jgi:hypothetical protein
VYVVLRCKQYSLEHPTGKSLSGDLGGYSTFSVFKQTALKNGISHKHINIHFIKVFLWMLFLIMMTHPFTDLMHAHRNLYLCRSATHITVLPHHSSATETQGCGCSCHGLGRNDIYSQWQSSHQGMKQIHNSEHCIIVVIIGARPYMLKIWYF